MALVYKKFLLFGDSITEFSFNTRMSNVEGKDEFSFGAAMVNAYTRKLDIVQRGFSGFNSRWALKLLPKILEQENNVAIATLFFGSNDACQHEHQHVPLPEYKENTKKLIEMFKKNGIKVVVIGPALYDVDKWYPSHGAEVDKGYVRSNELFAQYSEAAQEIANAQEVAFVNLHEAFKKQDDWKSLLCDGLHFSGKGYEVMFHEVIKTVEEKYPEFAPKAVEYKLPNWRLVKSDGSTLDPLL